MPKSKVTTKPTKTKEPVKPKVTKVKQKPVVSDEVNVNEVEFCYLVTKILQTNMNIVPDLEGSNIYLNYEGHKKLILVRATKSKFHKYLKITQVLKNLQINGN